MGTTSEVMEIVRELPGLTSGEIVNLMPHVKSQSVYSRLYTMMTNGAVRRENKLWYLGGGVAQMNRKLAETASTSDATTIATLLAKVAALEGWKADAIGRYPDLAIPPLLKRARDIVAKELLETGDRKGAADVENGLRDNALPVRLVLKMLEGDVA